MNKTTWMRAAGGVAIAAIGLLAASLPAPRAESGPEFSEPIELAVEASAQPSLWYCPWINSGASRSTDIAVASVPDVDITFTHPDPRVGEPEDVGFLLLDGPGAEIQDVAGIATRGAAPGFVEFSDGPATATAIVRGETEVSGDRCVGSIPKLWHIPGLTTREGYGLVLRLFNPIPDNAKVTVRASSELGSEALPDLQGIDVVGKTWVDIDLGQLIPFLDSLVVTVSSDEGIVIPAVVLSRPDDEASWPGTGLSTEWTFAAATLAGLTPRLSVWNPNAFAVDVEVDLYSRTSSIGAAFTETIEPGRPMDFPIGDQTAGPVGVRVRASGAVAAAVVAEDVAIDTPGTDGDETEPVRTRIAGTIGAPQESASWLLAGAGGLIGGESSIWVLNTSDEPITVTLQPLGSSALPADKVRIEANTVRRIRLTASAGVGGYRVDAAAPITASWSLQSDTGIALFAGIAIGE